MVLMKVVPLPTRLLVAAKSLIAYLGKMMLPFNLSPYYPYPHPQSISPFSLEYMIPLVIVITITVTCLVLMRNRKFLISVWSYYVITMVPVLGIVQVGDQAMADRYTYLPSLGPFLIAGLLSARVYERAAAPNRPGVLMRTAGFFVATTMLLAMAYTTSRQIGIWKNSVVFWNYVIDKESSGIPFAYSNLGEAYESKGQLDTAIKNYEIALRLKPDYAEAYNNLGAAYQSKGLFDKAIEHYRATLRLKPDDAVVYFNLGAAFASKGDFDTAIKHYEAALRLQPNFAEAHFGIGWSYLKKGFKDMAQKEYELGLAMKPDDYNARQVLISLIPQ
jgi:tetratricopeptide (TPR) repeat protein